MASQQNRSYKPITVNDLRRLGKGARADREDFFARHPKYEPLRAYVLAVALCQGAGLHYVNGKNGIKGFDVWTFYARHPTIVYPPRRRTSRDFGDLKVGRTDGWPHFVGRRVDCLGRSLSVPKGADPIASLHAYLSRPTTHTASLLAEEGVVLIEPRHLVGTIVWPGSAGT